MTELTPLVGEPLALDLVNTRAHTSSGEIDALATADSLRAWFALQADRLSTVDSGLAAVTGSDLARIRHVREQVATAVGAVRQGERPPLRTLRFLTDAQRAAPACRELSWDGSAVVAVTRRSGRPVDRLIAELAESAADLLSSESIRLVRRCEGPECRMLFLPAHPRRRWCSPALCGNRVRVARYYRRHAG